MTGTEALPAPPSVEPAGIEHLRPHYHERFRCIGASCEDTCCAGWAVHLDRMTYERYQRLTGSKSAEIARSAVARMPNATDACFAEIRLSPQLVCPFLIEQDGPQGGLCTIQLEHGESYLSETCRIYPRKLVRVEGTTETSLRLSCPEAARQLLLGPPIVTAKYIQAERLRKFGSGNHRNGYLWPLRAFVLRVLHQREYSMWERVLLLGIFLETMDQAVAEGTPERIPELIDESDRLMLGSQLHEILDELPRDTSLQVSVILSLVHQRLGNGTKHTRFVEILQEFVAGISSGIADTGSGAMAAHAVRLRDASLDYCEPFLEHYPALLENYLTNFVYQNNFPFGIDAKEQKSFYRGFLMLALEFMLIRGLMAGLAAHHREAFDETHVVRLVQAFTKSIDHQQSFLDPVLQGLSESTLSTLPGIARLLNFS